MFTTKQGNVKRYYNTNGDLVRYEIIKTEMRERGRRYSKHHRITAFVFQLFVWVAFTLFIAGTYLLATAQ